MTSFAARSTAPSRAREAGIESLLWFMNYIVMHKVRVLRELCAQWYSRLPCLSDHKPHHSQGTRTKPVHEEPTPNVPEVCLIPEQEEHLCLAKLARSSREESVVGSFAFISGAIAKRVGAPTTIEQSTARTGIPNKKVARTRPVPRCRSSSSDRRRILGSLAENGRQT